MSHKSSWVFSVAQTLFRLVLTYSLFVGMAQANTEMHELPLPELKTVPGVDLARYQGLWYQIAYYPNRFQKQCISNTTAHYKLRSNGEVEVINACKEIDGNVRSGLGRARVKQGDITDSSAKLEVTFAPRWLSWLPVVWGNYWVIQLADDYRYAVVGEPKREYLWILSRTPKLSSQDRMAINHLLVNQGYDSAALREELHP